jgi:hypothetical protein
MEPAWQQVEWLRRFPMAIPVQFGKLSACDTLSECACCGNDGVTSRHLLNANGAIKYIGSS